MDADPLENGVLIPCRNTVIGIRASLRKVEGFCVQEAIGAGLTRQPALARFRNPTRSDGASATARTRRPKGAGQIWALMQSRTAAGVSGTRSKRISLIRLRAPSSTAVQKPDAEIQEIMTGASTTRADRPGTVECAYVQVASGRVTRLSRVVHSSCTGDHRSDSGPVLPPSCSGAARRGDIHEDRQR